MLSNSEIQDLMKEFNANSLEELLWAMYVRIGFLNDQIKDKEIK